MNLAEVGEAILKVREAHRYCNSNVTLYGHDFEHCSMYLYLKELVKEQQWLEKSK